MVKTVFDLYRGKPNSFLVSLQFFAFKQAKIQILFQVQPLNLLLFGAAPPGRRRQQENHPISSAEVQHRQMLPGQVPYYHLWEKGVRDQHGSRSG